MYTLNIHTKSAKVHLAPVTHYIDLVGGLSVEVNGFSVRLIEVNTGVEIRPIECDWPFRSMEFGTRSKRIFKMEVLQKGDYLVEFINADKPFVKQRYDISLPFPFSLFGVRLPSKSVPNDELCIAIYRKH